MSETNANRAMVGQEKVVMLTGQAAEALNPSLRKRKGGRKTRRGGDNSGGLLQLTGQSLEELVDASGQQPLFGGSSCSNRHRYGGDNSGGLLQLAGQAQANGFDPMNSQETANQYAQSYQEAMKQMPLLNQSLSKTGGRYRGGDSTGATVNLSSTRAPGAGDVKPMLSGVSPSDYAPATIGGVLLKPYNKNTKVSLKAPKKGLSVTHKARKIRLGVKGMKTRLNRAKKAHAHAHNMSLAMVKQRLVKAGVIKASSKAPESMLRGMYADLLVTKKGL